MNGLKSHNASCFYPDKLPCYMKDINREYATIQVNKGNLTIVEAMGVSNGNFAIVEKKESDREFKK